jgi:hypothetical protein
VASELQHWKKRLHLTMFTTTCFASRFGVHDCTCDYALKRRQNRWWRPLHFVPPSTTSFGPMPAKRRLNRRPEATARRRPLRIADKNLISVICILSVYGASVAYGRHKFLQCVIWILLRGGLFAQHADPVRSPTTCGCFPGASLGCGIAPGHYFLALAFSGQLVFCLISALLRRARSASNPAGSLARTETQASSSRSDLGALILDPTELRPHGNYLSVTKHQSRETLWLSPARQPLGISKFYISKLWCAKKGHTPTKQESVWN